MNHEYLSCKFSNKGFLWASRTEKVMVSTVSYDAEDADLLFWPFCNDIFPYCTMNRLNDDVVVHKTYCFDLDPFVMLWKVTNIHYLIKKKNFYSGFDKWKITLIQ